MKGGTVGLAVITRYVDTVKSTMDWTLSTNVENLTLIQRNRASSIHRCKVTIFRGTTSRPTRDGASLIPALAYQTFIRPTWSHLIT